MYQIHYVICCHMIYFSLISYYCPTGDFTLNRDINIIHDENWYKSSVSYWYPDINLAITMPMVTSYQQLYYKSLTEGNLHPLSITDKMSPALAIRGVKASKFKQLSNPNSCCVSYVHLVLTFNGDLYRVMPTSLQVSLPPLLLASRVSDLDGDVYTQDNCCYQIVEDTTTNRNELRLVSQLLLQASADLLHLSCTSTGVFTASSTSLYHIDINNEVIRYEELAVSCLVDSLILDTDNTLYSWIEELDIIAGDIAYIYPGVLVIQSINNSNNNGSRLYNDYYFYCMDEEVIYIEPTTIVKDLMASLAGRYGTYLLLIDELLYRLTHTDPTGYTISYLQELMAHGLCGTVEQAYLIT